MHDYNCLTLSTQQSQENLNLHDYQCRTFKLETPIARGLYISTELGEQEVSSD